MVVQGRPGFRLDVTFALIACMTEILMLTMKYEPILDVGFGHFPRMGEIVLGCGQGIALWK